MKPPYTPRELVLAMAFALLLGAFIGLCFQVAELQRCIRFHEQVYDNMQIILTPKK